MTLIYQFPLLKWEVRVRRKCGAFFREAENCSYLELLLSLPKYLLTLTCFVWFFLIEYFFLPVSLFSADVLKIHFSPLYLDLGGQDGYFPAPRAPGTQPRVGGERTGDWICKWRSRHRRKRTPSGMEKPSWARPTGPCAFAGEANRAAALCFSAQPLPALHAAGFGFTE